MEPALKEKKVDFDSGDCANWAVAHQQNTFNFREWVDPGNRCTEDGGQTGQ